MYRYILVCFFAIIAQIWAPSLSAEGLGEPVLPRLLSIPDEPIEVGVGIKIDQITFIDQRSENYGVVGTLVLNWHDPAFAFDDGPDLSHRVLTPSAFVAEAAELPTLVPYFIIQNQQGNRWVQQNAIAISSNGAVRYFERFSTTLQAPYLDFRRYPFDVQQFHLEVESVYSEEFVYFVPIEELSGLGDLLGEEEWILENAVATAGGNIGLSGLLSRNVTLTFTGHRHLEYYLIRIFLPLLVLISVTWVTFFLEDYKKRIDIAGANLLIFVAFNFVVSGDLPRLGYVTFIDFVLAAMFVVTGGVIVLNAMIARLSQTGRNVLAHKIDNYIVKWVYPLGYLAIILVAIQLYLRN